MNAVLRSSTPRLREKTARMSSPRFHLSIVLPAINTWVMVYLGLVAYLLFMAQPALSQMQIVPTITTIAGTGTAGYSGDGGPASSAQLNHPEWITIDKVGNLYVSDWSNRVVRRIDATTGVISTVAGTGTAGFSGDGGPATSAQLSNPDQIALDNVGNIYVVDVGNDRIRMVAAGTGTITTVAGDGTSAPLNDGGPATSAALKNPKGLAIDNGGNLYISDSDNCRIREVAANTGIITTIAGNGTCANTGDGGPATSAQANHPGTLAFDGSGNLYMTFVPFGNLNSVRMINMAGIITTVTGNGAAGFSGDGGPATSAQVNGAFAVFVDPASNLYISDQGNHRIRRTNNGIITTVAGNGTTGYTGDGGPATNAELSVPSGSVGDGNGNLYISDFGANVIRKLSPTTSLQFPSTSVNTTSAPQTMYLQTTTAETISSITVPQSQGGKQEYTIAGITGCTVDGAMSNPQGTICAITVTFTPAAPGKRWVPLQVVTGSGNINFGLQGVGVGPLAALTPGIISTFAGTGAFGFSGDGGPATTATFKNPGQPVVDAAGNVYIADTGNNRVRKIAAGTGIITTIAGTGTAADSGDGGLASIAGLAAPIGLALDAAGNLYVADSSGYRVRKISGATGIISTVAGTGTSGYSGDGGPATNAGLASPHIVALDSAGNLYIQDGGNRVRKVAAGSGIITTIAGTGAVGYSGDSGPAISAELNSPVAIGLDSKGNLYIADTLNGRIRKVDANSGIITTYAGNGTLLGSTGDGGPATSAVIGEPWGITFDAADNLYIAGFANRRVRKINASTGIISTIAGSGATLDSGDGGPATSAGINEPGYIAFDGINSFYVTEDDALVKTPKIRKIDISQSALNYPTATTVGTSDGTDDPQTAILSNIGNATLTIPPPSSGSNPSVSANFTFNSTSICPQLFSSSSSQTLAAGVDCTIAIDFAPNQAGSITGAAVETDNSLNIPSSTQTIHLTATGLAVGTTTTLTGMPNPSAYSQAVVFTATVTPTTGTMVPTGSVQFSVDGTNVGGPVTLSNGQAIYTISTLSVNTHTVTAVYTPDSGNFTGSTASMNQTVTTVTSSATTLTVAPLTVMYGNPVTLTAVVAPSFATGTVSFYEGSTLLGVISLNNTGTAVLPVNTLNAGVHTIVAKYSGDPNVPANTSNTAQLTVTPRTAPGGGPAITVTVNDAARTTAQSNPPFTYSPSGQLVNGDTFATAISGTPTYFTVAGNAPGTFSITVSGLTSANYTISFVAGNLTVATSPSTTTLAAGPASPQYGNPVTLTAAVVPNGATGAVAFKNGSTVLGTGAVSNGVATLTTSHLNAGAYTITASYQGDTNYGASTSPPVTVTITPKTAPGGGADLTVAVGDVSRVYGQDNPAFTYTVTGALVNGDNYATAVTGVPVYSTAGIPTAPVGSYPISVAGLNSTNYVVAFVNGALTVTKATPGQNGTPDVTLTSTPDPAVPGQPVTFTATVPPEVTGTITFMDGSTVLGTATTVGGVATLTTTLSSGTHSVTAVYGGSANYNPATSAVATVVVGQAALDFTLTLTSSGTLTVIPGQSAPYTVQVAPTSTTYPGIVTFSATGLPPGAIISFSPTTVAANAGPTPSNVTVQTALQNAALSIQSLGSATLALLVLPLAASRRIRRNSRRFLFIVLLLFASLATATGLTGCGYNGNGFFGQAPKTYTITIIATSANIQHSVNATINLQ